MRSYITELFLAIIETGADKIDGSHTTALKGGEQVSVKAEKSEKPLMHYI
tara:strand:- start:296 stop:445 length:150 start_codon:yes stop_codon:yes gene_type:complete